MNGKRSRMLRRMALDEMIADNVPKEELVIARVRGHDRVIHDPGSVKAMEKALKSAFKEAVRRNH